eukprot:5237347-Amphidinium_carterae.1
MVTLPANAPLDILVNESSIPFAQKMVTLPGSTSLDILVNKSPTLHAEFTNCSDGTEFQLEEPNEEFLKEAANMSLSTFDPHSRRTNSGSITPIQLHSPCYDVAQYNTWEESFLLTSEIFSLRQLPCNSTPQAKSGARVAVFVYDKTRGTARIRGDMLAAAVSLLPGWTAFATHSSAFHLHNTTVSICVLVKHRVAGWCKRHSAEVIYWDILDTADSIANLIRGRLLDERFGINVVLTTNHLLAQIIRE